MKLAVHSNVFNLIDDFQITWSPKNTTPTNSRDEKLLGH